MAWHVMLYNMHIHNIHTRILFSVFSFSVVFSSSHVACRMSLFNFSTEQRMYYEICNSTRQRIYYETCNSTGQRTTRFAIQRDSVLRNQLRDLQFNGTACYEINVTTLSNLSNFWFSCSICMINCMIIRQLIWRFFQNFRRISEFLDWIRNRLFRNKIYSQAVFLTLENHSCTGLKSFLYWVKGL